MSIRYPALALALIVLVLIVPATAVPGGNWTEINGSAEFPERYHHTSVVFDDKMWVIGGYDSVGGYDGGFRNDTWYSSGGSVWYEANASAKFPARNLHSSVIYNSKMWVIGGQSFGGYPHKDIWSSTDGIIWNMVTDTAGFSARYSHASINFLNKIWVIGGYDGGYDDEVWASSDGVSWNKISSDGDHFTGRASHSSLVFNNKIWVIGGDTTGIDTGYKNDVWYSSDGITWTETAVVGDRFTPRHSHTSVVYDNKMWVIGGLSATGIMDDAWYSTDGITWIKTTPTLAPPARESHTSVVSGSKMWIIGGYDGSSNKNDVWASLIAPVAGFSASPVSGNAPLLVTFTDASLEFPSSYVWTFGDGSTSSSVNPVHSYTAAGTYPVSLTVTNSDGTSTETKAAYITVFAPSSSGTVASTSGDDDPPDTMTDVSHTPMTITVNVGGNSAVPLVTVTGTGLKDLIVTATVLAGPGTGIPPPPGTVYEYIGLVPARYTTITSGEITFSIPATWLEEHAIRPDTITMYHYTGTVWESLPTTVLATKNGQVHFSTTSPGFSLFAISGMPGELPDMPLTSPSPQASGDPTPVPEHTPDITQPLATRTTSPPQVQPNQPAPEFPLALIAVTAVACVGLFTGCMLVRRWWTRRQNPALFRKYE
ncbi:MAG: PGF-pre-PGF domain-containing protein [Methanoregula sp.]|nr:PGF-pre-PGF domain-containing protein [Methanoregula sp.]